MFTLHRIVWPLVNAFLITASLIYLMYLLVYIKEPELTAEKNIIDLRWPSLPEETEVITKSIKPVPPKEVQIQPNLIVDQPELDPQETVQSTWSDFKIGNPDRDLIRLDNSQLVLALGFPPEYPSSAITRGIEGYAVVGFSVNAAGQVFDAYIIESEPNSIFNKSALKAIKKFKYKAKMENGKPVATDGQRYLFTYKID